MNKNFYYPEEFNQKNVFLNTYNTLAAIPQQNPEPQQLIVKNRFNDE